MSSHDTAAPPTADPVRADAGTEASAEAMRLAAVIEDGLKEGRDVLTPEALQALIAACCKAYTVQVDIGNRILPLAERALVTSTDVMTTASGLLKAANLAVFELGMWQSWTGR
jgi:hypothetical protein